MTHDLVALTDARPERLAAIQDDAVRFREIAAALERSTTELAARLAEVRTAPAGSGQRAVERDVEVRRLTSRLRLLARYGADLCLGRFTTTDGEVVHVGRIGIADDTGRRLLVDWRTPAAEPFFAATLAHTMGLVSRRRYRWTRGTVTDFWDEVFDLELVRDDPALDPDTAFIATLAASRTSRMQDVLTTIQADQDAVIRATARGPLVVEGGPGTGKTVVALHRVAYLLGTDPGLERRGGVLFVGPNRGFLAYVADVLPDLGEDGVLTCTVRDLVPEGAHALPEADPGTARTKAAAGLLEAVERAVASYEQPPADGPVIETPWGPLAADEAVWEEAFGAADPARTHDDNRDEVWEALLDVLADGVDEDEAPRATVRRFLARDELLARTFRRAWPVLDPAGVVADLWSTPAFLASCAPWLGADERKLLHRVDARAWTDADLPLLDAARRRIGDPEAIRTRRRREAAAAAQHEDRKRVVEELIAADDGDLMLMSILRGQDAQNSMLDESSLPSIDPDQLAGPFAHIVVDEAQELTDAEWRMVLARCPSRSVTIVGDRAQARRGFPERWEERLARVGLDDVRRSVLTVGYRTPEEVMAVAEPEIRAALPDAEVPIAVRTSGNPVRRGSTSERDAVLDDWLAIHAEGTACVIGDAGFASRPRVRSLAPEQAKGLEFDLVVLVDPAAFGDGLQGTVDRYVAMTRATSELVLLGS